jgi:hypothetical protein
MSIKVSDRELARAEWSTTQVVVPGPVVVEVSAPKSKPFRFEQTGLAGSEVVVQVPTLEPSEETRGDTPSSETTSGTKLPYIVGGAGAGLVLTSLVIGLVAKSDNDSAMGDPAKVVHAGNVADLATIVGVTGGVAMAVGVVLYLRSRGDSDRVAVAPIVGSSSIGITVSGAF